ncbi:hypothetical protein M422DRAFT_247783 [Sphaerobolus stellatus SS14]|nr:hypothetical protein M422DRAFT_247783 [Sphaerobolus stellatus SS14]
MGIIDLRILGHDAIRRSHSENTSGINGRKHLKRKDVIIEEDLYGKLFARLDLPTAKTAKPGETQSVFVTVQDDICPIEALRNLSRIVPATAEDPLFSWRDSRGRIRPMVKNRALDRINGIFSRNNRGKTFGHSFRIGGASFYLSQGVEPEIVRLAGRWKSLAYEAYIRSFEQVISHYMANLTRKLPPSASSYVGQASQECTRDDSTSESGRPNLRDLESSSGSS